MTDYIRTEKQFRPFTILYHDLWRCPDLSRTERDVYISLLLYANSETMSCFPSYETLAADSKVSRRTVIDTISVLIEKGWIKKESRYDEEKKAYSSNIYILIDKLDKNEKEQDVETELQQVKRQADKLGYDLVKKPEGEKAATLEEVKEACEYADMIAECPELEEVIDSTMKIIIDTINDPNESQETKDIFKALRKKEILFSIHQLQQAKNVKNRVAYLKAILLKAKTQASLEDLKPKQGDKSVKNGFHNFKERSYDYDELERLLKKKR